MADTTVELERGLCYYFEQQKEFERRALPIEKQVAFGFEAGYQAGKAEVKARVARIFLPESKNNEWP
jgi:hypothetical protein